jgi:hypothetical protein
MLDTPRERIVLSLSLTVVAGLGLLGYIERDKLFPPKAPAVGTEAEEGGLNIPTIDEMCKTLGAASGAELTKCQQDERDAGEFVIAWMGFNNFIVDGQINVNQIQLLADLGQSAATSGFGTDPSSLGFGGFEPSTDPSLGGDPSGLGGQITAGIDPLTGEPQGFLQSPAELALYCLQMSGDWVTMHDCISENDPSSHIAGGGP